MIGNVFDKQCVTLLERSCTNKNGVCDYTGKRHFILSGSSPFGKPWTRVAQEYPKKLAKNMALVLDRGCKMRPPRPSP